ncbi:MAG: malate dehydrogenase, partial [Arcobacter sp.]|nr:malate dehydrogenase [Arcobacter sp.]
GKLAIKTTTQLNTQKDLSLAYTPGVAHPCLEIQANPEDAFKYTAKRNLVTAGLINACDIIKKNIEDLKVVVIGAGAAAISCARMYKSVGVKNLIMCDSKGVINDSRDDLNKFKKEFSISENITKLEAFREADVVLGLSKPGTFTQKHIAVMANEPIVFALSNPTPELYPEEILAIRDKAIVGTGRSDFPNQINNVIGFPFIFRGALDVQAKKINMQMKKAAAYAIADLARNPVTQEVKEIFGEHLTYSKEYIIPTAFDKRLIVEVSSAVAKAAVDSGVARIKKFDLEEYKEKLSKMI